MTSEAPSADSLLLRVLQRLFNGGTISVLDRCPAAGAGSVDAALDPRRDVTERLSGRPFRDLFPPDVVEAVAPQVACAFAGEEVSFDLLIGNRRLSVAAAPVPAGADDPIDTVLLVTNDVTDYRRFETALQDSAHDRAAFVAAISHDLKNPIGAISAQAQLLRRRAAKGTLDDAGLARGLDTIDATVARMLMMIEELSDISHLQAGQPLRLNREPTDLVTLARSCADAYQPIASRHDIVVTTNCRELVGHWDEVRLRRVVENLLINAIKYSPDGGRITLDVYRGDLDGLPAGCLAVRDEGVGIPERDLPYIFEQFRRGRNVRGIAGSGIGLAAARQIMAQHGGTIDVRSQEGAGSAFTICIPLPDADDTPAPLRHALAGAD